MNNNEIKLNLTDDKNYSLKELMMIEAIKSVSDPFINLTLISGHFFKMKLLDILHI